MQKRINITPYTAKILLCASTAYYTLGNTGLDYETYIKNKKVLPNYYKIEFCKAND